MQRRLAAIVHADLAGFTRMMEGAETRTFRHLKSAQIEVWRPAIDAASGRLVGTAGHAMLAEFRSALKAAGAGGPAHKPDDPLLPVLSPPQRMRVRPRLHLSAAVLHQAR